jgi:hypothetical protein
MAIIFLWGSFLDIVSVSSQVSGGKKTGNFINEVKHETLEKGDSFKKMQK